MYYYILIGIVCFIIGLMEIYRILNIKRSSKEGCCNRISDDNKYDMNKKDIKNDTNKDDNIVKSNVMDVPPLNYFESPYSNILSMWYDPEIYGENDKNILIQRTWNTSDDKSTNTSDVYGPYNSYVRYYPPIIPDN